MDEREDPRAAAIRELREETGVSSAEILAEVYPGAYIRVEPGSIKNIDSKILVQTLLCLINQGLMSIYAINVGLFLFSFDLIGDTSSFDLINDNQRNYLHHLLLKNIYG